MSQQKQSVSRSSDLSLARICTPAAKVCCEFMTARSNATSKRHDQDKLTACDLNGCAQFLSVEESQNALQGISVQSRNADGVGHVQGSGRCWNETGLAKLSQDHRLTLFNIWTVSLLTNASCRSFVQAQAGQSEFTSGLCDLICAFSRKVTRATPCFAGVKRWPLPFYLSLPCL